MSHLEVTRGEDWGNMFLPRTWPATYTDAQYRHLAQLHATAVERRDAIFASEHGLTGGWNLTAPTATFDHLLSLAQAVLDRNDYRAISQYVQTK